MPNSLRGFTLIELMIAVSIITIVSAATIPSFNAFITNQNLKQAQEQVKNGIRDAQNKAISGNGAGGSYTYWYIKFVDGYKSYSIGKTTSASPDATACSTPATVDEISPALQGGSTLAITSSPFCVFYKMGSAEEVGVGGVSDTAVVKLANKCLGVLINSSGLVKGVSATCP